MRKIYNILIKTILENVAGAIGNTTKGLIFFRTTGGAGVENRPYVGDGTAEREIMLRHFLAGGEEITAAEGGTGKDAADITAANVGDILEVNATKTGFDFVAPGAGGGQTLYDHVIGDTSADFVTVTAAIGDAGVTAGHSLFLQSVSNAENPNISKQVGLFGGGIGSVINGNLTISTDGVRLDSVRVTGTITVEPGVKNCILTNIWMDLDPETNVIGLDDPELNKATNFQRIY